ncbi:MAG: cytidine deaminase [Gemmatimonadaceae bacterium]
MAGTRGVVSTGDRALTSAAVLNEAQRAAQQAMSNAYAPYSNFRVGAALVCENGRIVVGCNVENSAYPAGICAERSALAAAVAAGERRFSTIVVATEADAPTPPCGVCRQALVEFAPTLDIVSVTSRGAQAQWRLSDLLAIPFTPASLSHA